MLVSALAGREHVLAAYEEAVKEGYQILLFRGCDVYRITSKSYKCNVKKIWKNRRFYASGFSAYQYNF